VGVSGIATVSDVVAELVADVQGGEADRVCLGIPCLDHATRGLEPGELWGDLGRTDSLKTMTYLNRLRHLVTRYPEAAWLVANLEMPKRQMLRRLLRMELGATESQLEMAIRNAHADVDEAVAKYEGRMFFIDRGSVMLSEIEQHADALRQVLPAGRTLRGIVVDHAGLVRPERPTASPYDRGTACAIGLKQLARRLGLVVFAVIQSNRAGKTSDGEPVALEAARDSGAFEENVDFMLGYSMKVESSDPSVPTFIRLKLLKNRRGQNVPLVLSFDPTTLRMGETLRRGSGG
jgi:replicative DNA helicase